IRLLSMDEEFERHVGDIEPSVIDKIRELRQNLAEMHDWPEKSVLSSHRHAVVLDLYEKVASHSHFRSTTIREKIDMFVTTPLGGLLVIAVSVFLLFSVSFRLGDLISEILDRPLNFLHLFLNGRYPGPIQMIIAGFVEGLEAGIGIVLPYLLPLLTLLAIYEDTGLLPRIAFIVDGLLHRVGMHGKSIIPIILGYGCNVPAIMATRNLESERDRRHAMLIIPFITCSARTVVILGLIGKYLGTASAILVYIGTMMLTMFVSYLLSRLNVHTDIGLVMEVPPLRRPYPNIIMKKVWISLYDFLVRAWPVIIISSMALSMASFFGADAAINRFLSPFTVWGMKLPESVGITLFLGLFRKELALVMLFSALGTSDIASVMTMRQIITFTVFTVLYIPCFATLVVQRSEGGWPLVIQSAFLNLTVALFAACLTAHLF
ncbi:MAG: ferrous iron transporter B, partial [Oligoflexales bacterium]|nr:ferrous iron transporter B [Oligoflexales bacterium]